MVERCLAKANVASSNLVSRSTQKEIGLAPISFCVERETSSCELASSRDRAIFNCEGICRGAPVQKQHSCFCARETALSRFRLSVSLCYAGNEYKKNSQVRMSIAYSNRHTPRFPQNCRNNFAKGYGVISFYIFCGRKFA